MDMDWNEEFILGSTVEPTSVNGDFIMLEALQNQQETMMLLDGLQTTESKLPIHTEMKYVEDNQMKFDLEPSNDSNLTSDTDFFLGFYQGNASYENILQPDVDPLISSAGNVEPDSSGNQPLFVDCSSYDYNNVLGYEDLSESQLESILTEYFPTTDTSSVKDDDMTFEMEKIKFPLFDAKVCLERLPVSTLKPLAEVKIENVDETDNRGSKQSVRKRSLKSVHRYCCKCKKFVIDSTKVSIPKNCVDCGDLMVYMCTKCNEKYFVAYSAMSVHRKICKSKKATEELSIPTAVLHCSDCDFVTLHKNSMDQHQKKTKHGRATADDVTGDVPDVVKGTTKHAAKQFCLNSFETVTDLSTAYKRFCKTCREITSNSSSIDGEPCKKCASKLFYLCVKCGSKSKCYKSITYHLEQKCLTKKYQCLRCAFVTSNWKFMRRHSRRRHLDVIFSEFNCEHCNYKSRTKDQLIKHLANLHRKADILRCKFCKNYSTTVASRFKKHMMRKHSDKDKKIQCEICLRYSTNDVGDLRKHIERRHTKK